MIINIAKRFLEIRYLFLLLPVLLLIIAVCFFDILSDKTPKMTTQEFISKELDINVSVGKVIQRHHDICLHDEMYFCSLSFADADLTADFDNILGWHPLPLSSYLQPLVADQPALEYRKCVPIVETGYYYYHDRSYNRYDISTDDSARLGLLNFTFAVYDIDSRMLYFYAEND